MSGSKIGGRSVVALYEAVKLFKEWVGKDAWKFNRWAARGTVPAITKEDMNKIRAKY